MIPLVYLLLAAALNAPPARTSSKQVAEEALRAPLPYIQELERVARDYGGQLLSAENEFELSTVVKKVVTDKSCWEAMLNLAAMPPPEIIPSSGKDLEKLIDSFVEDGASRFATTQPGMFRQAIELNIEFLHRMPPVDRDALQDVQFSGTPSMDELRPIEAALYSLAVVAALLDRDRPVHPAIGNLLIERWVEGSRWMLNAIDPLQAALESATNQFPESIRPNVVRLSYREDEDSLGQPVLLVWVVLRDNTPKEYRMIGGNGAIASVVVGAVRSSGLAQPVFLRARLASEVDPSAWDLRT